MKKLWTKATSLASLIGVLMLTGCKSKEEKLIEALMGYNKPTIWDFIKEHWVVILIVFVILGIVGNLLEKIEEIDLWKRIEDLIEAIQEKKKLIKKYGGEENYEKYKQTRDRVCSANSKNSILVYGFGGRSNIIGVRSDAKSEEDGKLLVEVKNGLDVRCDIVEFVYGISSFEYGVVEMSKVKNVETVKDELLSFLETNAADIQGLRGYINNEVSNTDHF